MTNDRLRQLVQPSHTAIVTMELQKGVVGDEAILPALPLAVRECGMLDVAGRVCAAGREHGVRVVHATVSERGDGAGQAVNCRILRSAPSGAPRSDTCPPTSAGPAPHWSTSSTCSPTTSRSHACTA